MREKGEAHIAYMGGALPLEFPREEPNLLRLEQVFLVLGELAGETLPQREPRRRGRRRGWLSLVVKLARILSVLLQLD